MEYHSERNDSSKKKKKTILWQEIRTNLNRPLMHAFDIIRISKYLSLYVCGLRYEFESVAILKMLNEVVTSVSLQKFTVIMVSGDHVGEVV